MLICLILWLRPTHQPHGGRDCVCLERPFPIRGSGPEEPFNKLEGREGGGQETPLEQGGGGRIQGRHKDTHSGGEGVKKAGSKEVEAQGRRDKERHSPGPCPSCNQTSIISFNTGAAVFSQMPGAYGG